MCDEAVEAGQYGPCSLASVPDHFKTQEMCNKAVEAVSWLLYYVHDCIKTQGMCNDAIQKRPRLLEYVPDWFVTQGQIKLWHDDNGYYKSIEWYDSYIKRRAQKASIKEELLPIALHPSRWWDWCVPEDEKKEKEKLVLTT